VTTVVLSGDEEPDAALEPVPRQHHMNGSVPDSGLSTSAVSTGQDDPNSQPNS